MRWALSPERLSSSALKRAEQVELSGFRLGSFRFTSARLQVNLSLVLAQIVVVDINLLVLDYNQICGVAS